MKIRNTWRAALALAGIAVLVANAFAAAGSITTERVAPLTDSTAGNFTWTVDTIGADGSTLYDCCIVNDSLAYAVGWIMPRDSSKQSRSLGWYNAAVWNGAKWTPFQVPVYFSGRKTFSPVHSVFARSSGDVWFGLYYMVHWNGRAYSQVFPRLGTFENKIWESPDGSRIYAVGDYGMISFSPDGGKSWKRVRTGTSLQFRDIWGSGSQVVALASGNSGGGYLVRLNGAVSSHLVCTLPFARSLSGLWFVHDRKYFIVGTGIFENVGLSRTNWRFDPFIWHLNHYETTVRGDSANDVVIAGLGGTVAHWNGIRWRVYRRIGDAHDRIRAVSMSGNLVVAVGQRYFDNIHNCGVIYTGIRPAGGNLRSIAPLSRNSMKEKSGRREQSADAAGAGGKGNR